MDSSPKHIVAYTDGELRQQYETATFGQPVSGEPTIDDEADGVAFVHLDDLDQYDIHPRMRQQIGDYLSGNSPSRLNHPHILNPHHGGKNSDWAR